jgi:hypothetical protein
LEDKSGRKDSEYTYLGNAHELADLGNAFEGRRLGLGELERVLVEVLEHLLESDRVVGHEGQKVLLRGPLAGFGFLDFFSELGRAVEDGFVGMELVAVGSKLDDEDCGGEVAGGC